MCAIHEGKLNATLALRRRIEVTGYSINPCSGHLTRNTKASPRPPKPEPPPSGSPTAPRDNHGQGLQGMLGMIKDTVGRAALELVDGVGELSLVKVP